MKELITTTTGNLFNFIGILNYAGDYAGKYQDEAIALLNNASIKKEDIFAGGCGWADIMINEKDGKIYAVWANDELITQEGLLEYLELEELDCPAAFKDASEKFINS